MKIVSIFLFTGIIEASGGVVKYLREETSLFYKRSQNGSLWANGGIYNRSLYLYNKGAPYWPCRTPSSATLERRTEAIREEAARELMDKIIALVAEGGGWITSEKIFSKGKELNKITLEITLKIDEENTN